MVLVLCKHAILGKERKKANLPSCTSQGMGDGVAGTLAWNHTGVPSLGLKKLGGRVWLDSLFPGGPELSTTDSWAVAPETTQTSFQSGGQVPGEQDESVCQGSFSSSPHQT